MRKGNRTIAVLKNSVPAEAESAVVPAVLPPDRMVAEVAKVLDVIAKRLELVTPHPATARRVRGARTVPRNFVLSLVAAAQRMPDLPTVERIDSDRTGEVLESIDALRLLAERTAIFLTSVNYTIEARWAEVVAHAMRTFTVASIVAEDPAQAELAAEVENLRRQLGRKGVRRRKAKKDEGAG